MPRSLVISGRKCRISPVPCVTVSQPQVAVSRKNDVQTITWEVSRDTAFILFPLFPFLHILSAQKKGRDDAEPTPPLSVKSAVISAHGALRPAL